MLVVDRECHLFKGESSKARQEFAGCTPGSHFQRRLLELSILELCFHSTFVRQLSSKKSLKISNTVHVSSMTRNISRITMGIRLQKLDFLKALVYFPRRGIGMGFGPVH